MYNHTFYKIANQQIRHHATHKVGCRPVDLAYGYFNLPPGCVMAFADTRMARLEVDTFVGSFFIYSLISSFI